MRNSICFLAVVILAGCSSTPIPVTSPYFLVPPGSKLVLNKTLTIPPNNARVYIQYGKVVSSREKDDFHAHCWFLSWKVLDTPQIIDPDTFTITKSTHQEGVVSRKPTNRYAVLDVAYTMFDGGDGGPMALVYSTEMHIHSDKQPNIRRFICSHWEDPHDASHLTVAEMQKTLGNIGEIRLNQTDPGK